MPHFDGASAPTSLAGWLPTQSFCGGSGMRACKAPDRLSFVNSSSWRAFRAVGGSFHAAQLERQLVAVEMRFAIGRDRPIPEVVLLVWAPTKQSSGTGRWCKHPTGRAPASPLGVVHAWSPSSDVSKRTPRAHRVSPRAGREEYANAREAQPGTGLPRNGRGHAGHARMIAPAGTLVSRRSAAWSGAGGVRGRLWAPVAAPQRPWHSARHSARRATSGGRPTDRRACHPCGSCCAGYRR